MLQQQGNFVAPCADCPYGGKCIGWKGDPEAELVIVGEAPGTDELRRGIPFTGPSGQLLDRCIEGAGLSGVPVFITNALSCRPPIGTPPSNEGIRACQSRLGGELSQSPRRLIIAVGNSALKSISNNLTLKITSERGKPFNTGWGLVVPTFHPAAVLRKRGDLPKLEEDFQYAADLYFKGQEGLKTPGEVKWNVATEENIDQIVANLQKYPLLAVDIETHTFNARFGRILCIGITWERNKAIIIPGALAQATKPLFENPNVRFVWHNGKYDTAFLATIGITARIDEDSMLQSYALSEQQGGHGLKELASDLIGAPDYKDVIRRYVPHKTDSFAKIPKPKLYKYLAQDADNTFQIHSILSTKLEQDRGPNWAYKHVMLPASAMLREVERAGLYIDKHELGKLHEHFTENCESQRNQMEQLCGHPFNPNSPKQLMRILWDMGICVPNTREDTLEGFSDNRFVAELMRYRKDAKSLGTYVEGIAKRIEPDGRVHPTFLIHGTTNGRLSCQNPNTQNITRGSVIKREFGSPEGYVLVEIDYSQAEMRSLAHISGDENLTQLFIDGRDIHDEMSLELFGPDFTEEQRVRAKMVNFGITYGRGGDSIAEQFSIPRIEGHRMVTVWFNRFPRARDYLNRCAAIAAAGGTLTSPFGYKRRFGFVTKEVMHEAKNEAKNFNPANTASCLTVISACRAQPTLKKMGVDIINLVHDSNLLMGPASVMVEAAEYAISVFEETPKLTLHTEVPFVADAKIGRLWGDMVKLKNYKPEPTLVA